MFPPVKVMDVELSRPLADVEELADYTEVLALIRLHGEPIGFVKAPVVNGRCSAQALRNAIVKEHSLDAARVALRNRLMNPNGLAAWQENGGQLADLFSAVPTPFTGPYPSVTVAVCTRDRTADLARCLEALQQLSYPDLEILVVDNAPGDDATEQLVRADFPAVRYVREPRPGLDWARNRAIREARGEIIAYTDDDVIVDPGWVQALVQPFVADPTVMAVTGLVAPYELETEAQVLFEEYGGFSRGFRRRWCRVDQSETHCWEYRGTGQFGTGANMAFRRLVFDQIGPFDPALDVGTVTNGGGDLEMFFRVLKEGYTLVYEPAAIVRHRHRRSYEKLRTQITNNGIGLYAFFVRSAWAYREERRPFWRIAVWWLWWWMIRQLILSFFRPDRFPRELIWAELRGALIGLRRYRQARKTAVAIANASGESIPERPGRPQSPHKSPAGKTAVRAVDVGKPLPPQLNVSGYAQTVIYVTWGDQAVGQISVINAHKSICRQQLIAAIVDELTMPIIVMAVERELDRLPEQLQTELEKFIALGQVTAPLSQFTPEGIVISIVVATLDRPDDLRICLQNLLAQEIDLPVEIVVVDNHPQSGQTPPVIADFPGVVLVNESRRGLAYARNAGVTASRGDIVVMTDDDVIAPPGWLAQLVAPFAEENVMAVTGNVLPWELETAAQKQFEHYGGLGRGFAPKRVDGKWFEGFRLQGVPTWTLGATANAAFRASIFSHPQIGLMDEALGPGMPSGVGEDTYLFYKVLQAGYTLIYQPGAFVWHKHRRTMAALRRQLFGYSKGHVAYHLTTFLRDGDWRALIHIGVQLPLWNLKRLVKWTLRLRSYPLRLILLEMWGNLLGPWVLWRSRRRVRREGRSREYVPVLLRGLTPMLGETTVAGRSPASEQEVRHAVDVVQ